VSLSQVDEGSDGGNEPGPSQVRLKAEREQDSGPLGFQPGYQSGPGAGLNLGQAQPDWSQGGQYLP
jgi:hypothetical protein